MVNMIYLLWCQSSLTERVPLCQLWLCSICKNSSSAMALEVSLFSVANMTTSSFINLPINLQNHSSSVYYGSFNRNSQNSQAKRWTKDNKHYNSKSCTHCGRRGHTLDECHCLYGFPPNYKRKKFFINNATTIKKENESETLTKQKES